MSKAQFVGVVVLATDVISFLSDKYLYCVDDLKLTFGLIERISLILSGSNLNGMLNGVWIMLQVSFWVVAYGLWINKYAVLAGVVYSIFGRVNSNR